MPKKPKGQPFKVKTPEDMWRLIEEYRVKCEQDEQPFTYSGARLHMGIHSKQTLCNYKEREGFAEPIAYLRALAEHELEKGLHGKNPAGCIFGLKNFGWTDRVQTEHTGKDGAPLLSPEETARRIAYLLTQGTNAG